MPCISFIIKGFPCYLSYYDVHLLKICLQTAIRAELSSLSFEELQKLKERIGAKVYKEALFGKKDKDETDKPKIFKRENKNRPREVSSKKPVPFLKDTPVVKKKEIRDPR